MPLPMRASRHGCGDVPGATIGGAVTVGWVVIDSLGGGACAPATSAGQRRQPTAGDELTCRRQHKSGELGGAQFLTQDVVRYLQGVGHDGQRFEQLAEGQLAVAGERSCGAGGVDDLIGRRRGDVGGVADLDEPEPLDGEGARGPRATSSIGRSARRRRRSRRSTGRRHPRSRPPSPDRRRPSTRGTRDRPSGRSRGAVAQLAEVVGRSVLIGIRELGDDVPGADRRRRVEQSHEVLGLLVRPQASELDVEYLQPVSARRSRTCPTITSSPISDVTCSPGATGVERMPT